MALPTSYTETTYKTYLHSILNQGGFADDMGWSVAGGQYNEIVNDALLYYDASDITTITGASNINKIRMAGQLALWESVLTATTHYRQSSTPDGASSSLNQVWEHAQKQVDMLRIKAASLGLSGVSIYPPIRVKGIRITDDPYRYTTNGDEYA